MTTTYTIWSRGRLLGESTLAFVRCIPKHRMGSFHPSENALPLVERATEGQQVAFEFYKLDRKKTSDSSQVVEEALHEMPYIADLMAAHAHREALEMELRGPNGRVIPTEWIDIRDSQIFEEKNAIPGVENEDDLFEDVVLSEESEEMVRELQEFAASLKDDYSSEWNAEPEEFPRYHVQVMLLDEADLP